MRTNRWLSELENIDGPWQQGLDRHVANMCCVLIPIQRMSLFDITRLSRNKIRELPYQHQQHPSTSYAKRKTQNSLTGASKKIQTKGTSIVRLPFVKRAFVQYSTRTY